MIGNITGTHEKTLPGSTRKSSQQFTTQCGNAPTELLRWGHPQRWSPDSVPPGGLHPYCAPRAPRGPDGDKWHTCRTPRHHSCRQLPPCATFFPFLPGPTFTHRSFLVPTSAKAAPCTYHTTPNGLGVLRLHGGGELSVPYDRCPVSCRQGFFFPPSTRPNFCPHYD